MGDTAIHTPSAPPTAKPTRVRYLVLAAACSLALLTYVHRLGFTRGVPRIADDLGFDDRQMGLFASAFLIAYALFQVPGGSLADRFGGRTVLTALVVGWSLLTSAVALTGFVPGLTGQFLFLLILRFLFGMFQAGGFPTLARVIADWVPLRQRASAQGLVWMCSRLGGALSPFGVVWLFNQFGGWSVPFAVLGAVGLVWCALFWPWFRNRPEEMPAVNLAERELITAGRSAVKPTREPVPWGAMLTSRNAWGLAAMYGAVGFGGNFITAMLPQYLIRSRHLGERATSVIFSLPLAFAIVSCVLGGVLSDWIIRRTGNRKWGRRIGPMVGLSIAGMAFASVSQVEETWLLGFLFTLTFFCNDLMMGPAWAACADVGGRYTGSLSGFMNMMGSLTGSVGMYIAGILLEAKQTTLLFAIFGGAYILAALCWLVVDVTRPLVPDAARAAD